MGSIIGKQFESINNGITTKVISIEGNIAVLENDQRISVERLLDSKHYTECVTTNGSIIDDISNNSNNGLHNQLFNQIKSISSDSINKANDNGGVIVEKGINSVNPVESHNDAQKRMKGEEVVVKRDDSKYYDMLEKAKSNQLKLESEMKRQTAQVSKIVEGVEEDVYIPKFDNNTYSNNRDTSVNVVENVGSSVSIENKPNGIQYSQVNPMFTKMKRTNKVSLKIDLEEMIPNKELLKMLEEGFEDSVIDYLTDEIAGKVLTDNTIKSQIRKKLYDYVYKKSKTKTKTRRKTVVKKT